MAWGFEADCPNCGHRWEGIQANLHIGPWSWYGPSLQNGRSLFCPRCYNRLYYPKCVERAVWRQWYERLLGLLPETSAAPVWLLTVLERVNASFALAPWYVPKAIDLGEVLCPGCCRVMVASAEERDQLTCPRCGSNQPVLTGFTSHVSLAVGEDGFN